MLLGRHLKNRILVQDRGGAEFQTAGNLLVVEVLKRGTNKDIGPKDIFEMASRRAVSSIRIGAQDFTIRPMIEDPALTLSPIATSILASTGRYTSSREPKQMIP